MPWLILLAIGGYLLYRKTNQDVAGLFKPSAQNTQNTAAAGMFLGGPLGHPPGVYNCPQCSGYAYHGGQYPVKVGYTLHHPGCPYV